jgi:predicted RNA-binding protein YlqC (UPF0109 family)
MTTITNSPEALSQDILSRILREITLHPQHIRISNSPLGRTHTIKVQVHRGDMSRVIGSGGSHAQALTRLVQMIGQKRGVVVNMRMLEPEIGEKDKYQPFEPREQWPKERAEAIMRDIAEAVFDHAVKVEAFDGEDYMSIIEVTVSSRENRQLVTLLQETVTPLFNAIGKANGRHLTVNIAPGEVF